MSAKKGGRAASLVALGILLSRVTGLIRSQVFAHFFGSLPEADAVQAAFRIPNLLQNVFGEGAMSASFIPVYAGLLAKGDDKEADRVAGAIAALLALVVAVIVLLGVLATPLLIDLIAPGFEGERRALTITLVRIFFPGAGFLALSAWCLGVLNSHHKFLLSYASPALYNAVIVATLIAFGRRVGIDHLAVLFAWGSVVASAAQQVATQQPGPAPEHGFFGEVGAVAQFLAHQFLEAGIPGHRVTSWPAPPVRWWCRPRAWRRCRPAPR